MADQDLHRVAFPTLDDVQVATLAKFGMSRVLRDGELLFKAGDREDKFFVVERGAVEIVEHSSGETKSVALHERHAFGGDVSLATGRRSASCCCARLLRDASCWWRRTFKDFECSGPGPRAIPSASVTSLPGTRCRSHGSMWIMTLR